MAIGNIPDLELPIRGSAVTFEVSSNFRDPDGGTLTYAVTSSDAGVVRAEASGTEVTLFPLSAGTATITVTATDTGGLAATQTFRVTVALSVNRAPQAVGRIPDQTLTEEGSEKTLDVSDHFSDPDGDDLTYRATSSRANVVWVRVSGSDVTLTPGAEGTATVGVIAADPGGRIATQVFTVTVATIATSEICRNSVATPSGSSEELVRDCGILLEARDTLRGAGGRDILRLSSLNWSADRPIGDWRGVEHTPVGVIELDVHNADLEGTIPAILGNLTNLEKLELKFNDLTGTIPESLGNLANLRVLNLRDNELEGAIPHSLGNLRNLEELKLYDNDLTGRIPDSLGNLRNLRQLWAWDNELSGTIPDSLGNMTNLVELSFGQNNLTGPIPDSLARLTNLQHLGLYLNGLSGAVPAWLGNLTNLQELRLNHNNLSGTIPNSLGNLPNLRQLDLRLNRLTGCVPASLERFFSTIEWQQGAVHLELCGTSSGESTAMSAGAPRGAEPKPGPGSVPSVQRPRDPSRNGAPRSPPISRVNRSGRRVRRSATGVAHGLSVGRDPMDIGPAPPLLSVDVRRHSVSQYRAYAAQRRILAMRMCPSATILRFHRAMGT